MCRPAEAGDANGGFICGLARFNGQDVGKAVRF